MEKGTERSMKLINLRVIGKKKFAYPWLGEE